jgi:hypothetical protein
MIPLKRIASTPEVTIGILGHWDFSENDHDIIFNLVVSVKKTTL